MKISSIETVYDLMRYCRMPLWFQRSIRDMKVGDTFILGKYTHPVSHDGCSFYVPQPDSDDEACFVAEAWIEKERGIYSFHATWTFPTKPDRAFIMTLGEFKIHKGGVIEFDDKNDALRSFARVCRYLGYLLGRMTYDDKKFYFENKSFPLFNGVWLDSDCNERRQRAVEIDGKIKRVWVNYRNHMPTHQLSAIIEASFALGILPQPE
ncbi:hypothetical protein [Serratia fonticola]|jgi:hypothetical protein